MSVMTVLGPVEVESLGMTLSHEHIFIDIRNQFTEFSDSEKARISRQKVCKENAGELCRNPYAIKDNLLLDDVEVAASELDYFKKAGGRTIVDCTSIGINRDARKLRELAGRTGLNIIAGSGYYTADTHPAGMDKWSPEEIAEQIIRDLTIGMEATDIKAGVIGEIGTGSPVHPNEKKNLLAAAIAHRQTCAPIYVHTYPWRQSGLEITNLFMDENVNPAKIVICHTDVEPDAPYIRELLSKGVFIEFDNFGKEFDIKPEDRGFAGGIFVKDIERVRLIKECIEWGFENQLLITNDICLKSMLHAYGGAGYDHIVRNIVPMMLAEGISQETIDVFLFENPVELLV